MKRRVHLVLRVVFVVAALAGSALVAPPGTSTGATSTASASTAHPRLLFDAADVPALRARVSSGVPAQAWATLQRRAEQYMNQTVPSLLDGSITGTPAIPNQAGRYAMDLAFAYLIGGDERYGRRSIDLLLLLSENGWPAGSGDRRELQSGNLSRDVALAFDWSYDLMSAGERDAIVASIVAELRPIDPGSPDNTELFSCLGPSWWGHQGLNNWLGVCGGGAGLLLLAIEGEAGAPADLLAPYITRARDRTLQHIGGLPYPDRTIHGAGGDGAEGVHYTVFGLKNALPFAFAFERSRGEDITAVNPGLSNVPVWLSYEALPGEGARFGPRNDSFDNVFSVYEVGPMFFDLRDDGVPGWLWDHTAGQQGDDIFGNPAPVSTDPTEVVEQEGWTRQPLSPEVFTIIHYRSPEERPRTRPDDVAPLTQHYPERGLVHFRTGFSDSTDDLLVTYEARRNANGHHQADLGNFTIYGYGAGFAIDSGYPAQDGGDAFSGIRNSLAVGHNVPIIDLSDSTQYYSASRLGSETIPYFAKASDLAYARSDLRSAYTWPNSTSGPPWADRNVLMSRSPGEPVMVAIADTLKRTPSASHQYTWQVHTDGSNRYIPTGTGSFLSVAPNGASMAVAVAEAAGPRALGTQLWTGSTNRPVQTLVRSNAPQNAKRPQFDHLAVLAITPPGGAPATTTPLTVAGGSAASVAWDGGEALVASARRGSTGVTGAVTLDGVFGKVTRGRGETALDRGTLLAAGGREYVSASAASSVLVSGDEVVADGPVGATYRVFAPQPISTVTLNGATSTFVRDGDYVSFPAPEFALSTGSDVVAQSKNVDGTAEVFVTPLYGFTAPVALSVAALPEGVTASFTPEIMAPGSTSMVTLRAGPKTRPGTYVIDVVGEASGVRRTRPLSFVVIDDP